MKVWKDAFWMDDIARTDTDALDDTTLYVDTTDAQLMFNYIMNTTHKGDTFFDVAGGKVKVNGVFVTIIGIKRKVNGVWINI